MKMNFFSGILGSVLKLAIVFALLAVHADTITLLTEFLDVFSKPWPRYSSKGVRYKTGMMLCKNSFFQSEKVRNTCNSYVIMTLYMLSLILETHDIIILLLLLYQMTTHTERISPKQLNSTQLYCDILAGLSWD